MTRFGLATAGFAAAAATTPWWPWPAAASCTGLAAAFCALGVRASASVRSRLFGTLQNELPAPADTVALTFDDGPDAAATPRLLDLLREHRATATFFVVGERVRALPTLCRRMRDEGHTLGNHGDHHAWTAPFRLGPRLHRDLLACQDAVAAATGAAPRWHRPPYGVRNHATHPVCARLGLAIAGWSVRGLDLPGAAPERVLARLRPGLRPGAIVLLHDGGRPAAQVARTAEIVLAELAARGLGTVGLD